MFYRIFSNSANFPLNYTVILEVVLGEFLVQLWNCKNMESLQTILSREVVFRRSAVDDTELNSWRRNRRLHRQQNYSDGQLRTLQPLPEQVSFNVDDSTSLNQTIFHRTPKYRRKSVPLCVYQESPSFHRSSSGSRISLITGSPVYAGARFSEAPSPKLLPLPPRHWLDGDGVQRPAVCGEMTKQLKSVLQVQ